MVQQKGVLTLSRGGEAVQSAPDPGHSDHIGWNMGLGPTEAPAVPECMEEGGGGCAAFSVRDSVSPASSLLAPRQSSSINPGASPLTGVAWGAPRHGLCPPRRGWQGEEPQCVPAASGSTSPRVSGWSLLPTVGSPSESFATTGGGLALASSLNGWSSMVEVRVAASKLAQVPSEDSALWRGG